MQILRQLYQVSGDLNGLTWDGVDAGYNDCNTYVLERPEGLILFDCGCGDTLDQLFANMRYWGLDPDRITHCLLTHSHHDHAAAGSRLKQRGVQFIASPATADAVATGDMRCCGFAYHKPFVPFTVDRTIADDEMVEIHGVAIWAMHLPGHTQGCTCYLFEHENRHIVVSGDVIGTLLAGDFGWSGSIDFNKPAYLESLKRLAKIGSHIMLPGHGLIYFHQPQRRVENVLNAALMQWR